jgi:acyl-CoA reductase-like NAD-dependent aldehyde dehydrogenase
MRKSLCRYFATDTFGLFVNGKEIFPNGCQLFDIENPAIAKPVYKAVQANINDVDDAINKAHETFKSGKWSNLDVRLRSKILYRIADSMRANIPRLIDLEVAQTGRAVKEMKAQLARLPEWFEYYGSLIRTHEGSCPPFLGNYLNYVKRVPLGVCGLLTPWNHPMLIAVKKIAPAIACGNSVVVKPSELAPASVIELAKLCTESDLPDGVLQVLTGTGSLTGQAICSHPHIRKVDLTGGTSTGLSFFVVYIF